MKKIIKIICPACIIIGTIGMIVSIGFALDPNKPILWLTKSSEILIALGLVTLLTGNLLRDNKEMEKITEFIIDYAKWCFGGGLLMVTVFSCSSLDDNQLTCSQTILVKLGLILLLLSITIYAVNRIVNFVRGFYRQNYQS